MVGDLKQRIVVTVAVRKTIKSGSKSRTLSKTSGTTSLCSLETVGLLDYLPCKDIA